MRDRVRRLGLLFALGTRILLLLSLSWVMSLTATLFSLFNQDISGRDLILLLGGLFLLWKASKEIYLEVEAEESLDTQISKATETSHSAKVFWSAVIQIGILDIVFSLDSVITAVGLVDDLSIMIAAVLASVGVMLFAAKPIGDFVHHHPSIKVLALSFLTIVGLVLIAESMDVHIPKGYVYFAMAFSLSVEFLNIRARTKKNKLTD
jgi:predicted tellurium resistance membrane protein TerC